MSRGSFEEVVEDIMQYAEGVYALADRSYASLRSARGGHDACMNCLEWPAGLVGSTSMNLQAVSTGTALDLHRQGRDDTR